jgi:hypothetical protein
MSLFKLGKGKRADAAAAAAPAEAVKSSGAIRMQVRGCWVCVALSFLLAVGVVMFFFFAPK